MNENRESWEIRFKEMDLFTGLDSNLMREIADTACTEATYTKGEVIFNEGDPANALFIIERGTVDLKIGEGKSKLEQISTIYIWKNTIDHKSEYRFRYYS